MIDRTINSRRLFIHATAVTTLLTVATPAFAGPGHGKGAGAIETGQPGNAADVSRDINVIMRDNLYEPAQIAVKAGETVRFKVVNKGEILHEFNLGTKIMHAAHQKEMMTMMENGMLEVDRINHEKMKMDHGGGKGMSHDDPNSILVEPGKSDEVIWKFTKEVKMEFACNIPGHYESGMVGPIKFK